MPKLKTKSSAKKRFSKTGTGKIKRNFAYKGHCLEEKTQKMKRKARVLYDRRSTSGATRYVK